MATSRPLDARLRLMTKVARMYHEHGARQAEIATTLGLSQATVSRLLKRAAETGVVRTIVTVAPGLHAELEERIERRFGLAEAVVVDADPAAGESERLATLGAAAAAYLETSLGTGERIGVSTWSETLLATVERMRPLAAPAATEVVQLLGGTGSPETQGHSTRLLAALTRAVGGTPVAVQAPGIVADRAMRDALLADTSMQGVLRRWSALTVAIIGIGSIEPSDVLRVSGNAFAPDDRSALLAAGAVGDICHRVFRADGSPVTGGPEERVVAIDAPTLLGIPRRVGIAGGPRKLAAIRGALAGGWVTTLVTDVTTAEALADEG